ncbi:hypothetical protein [Brassicibacter mesophilus]|uniref:hypothetical protein n=1 Tax=Brassicibacter mesophilus TaxID=745119 RepID=UPI003D1A6FA0
MNEKTMQVGKYIVTVSTNKPSMEALQNFDKKIKKMPDSCFEKHCQSKLKIA